MLNNFTAYSLRLKLQHMSDGLSNDSVCVRQFNVVNKCLINRLVLQKLREWLKICYIKAAMSSKS